MSLSRSKPADLQVLNGDWRSKKLQFNLGSKRMYTPFRNFKSGAPNPKDSVGNLPGPQAPTSSWGALLQGSGTSLAASTAPTAPFWQQILMSQLAAEWWEL